MLVSEPTALLLHYPRSISTSTRGTSLYTHWTRPYVALQLRPLTIVCGNWRAFAKCLSRSSELIVIATPRPPLAHYDAPHLLSETPHIPEFLITYHRKLSKYCSPRSFSIPRFLSSSPRWLSIYFVSNALVGEHRALSFSFGMVMS